MNTLYFNGFLKLNFFRIAQSWRSQIMPRGHMLGEVFCMEGKC